MEKLGIIKTKKTKFILSFISGILFLIGQGVLYGAAGICVYIVSYIHYKDKWVNMQYGNLMLPLLVFFLSLFSPLSGPLEKSVGPVITLLIGSIIIEFSLFLLYIQRNIWFFYCIVLISGLGFGLTLNIPIKNACFYYPEKKGLISAIIMCFVLISGAIFILIGEKIVNPGKETVINEETDPFYSEEVSKRVKNYFIFGMIFFPIIIFFSLSLFFKYHPNFEIEVSNKQVQISKIETISKGKENNEEENKENDNNEEEKNDNNEEEKNDNLHIDEEKNNENDNDEEKNNEKNELNKDLLNKEEDAKKRANSFYKISSSKDIIKALKNFRFWRIIIISGLMPFFLFFLQSSFRAFVVMIGVNTNIIFYLASTLNIISCVAGPVWASLIDKFGYQPIMKINGFLSIGVTIYFFLFMNHKTLYPIGLLIAYITITGINSSVNPHIMQVYGMTYFLTIGGFAKLFIELFDFSAGLCSIILSLFFENAEKLLFPYKMVAVGGCVFSALGLIMTFFENDEKFIFEDEDEKKKCFIKEDENGENQNK